MSLDAFQNLGKGESSYPSNSLILPPLAGNTWVASFNLCYLSLQNEEKCYSMIFLWPGTFLIERTFIVQEQT